MSLLQWIGSCDWSLLTALAVGIFGLGGSYSKSNQQSGSTSVGPLGSGQNFGDISNLLTDLFKGSAPGLSSLPGQSFMPIQPTALNEFGLYKGQQDAFGEAVSQALGKLSGNFANRGFNTPRSINAIAGSAAQNVLPQFAPLMGQQIGAQDQFRHQLSLAPEEVRLKRQQQLTEFFQALSQALGQTSTSFGNASSFSVGGNVGGGSAGPTPKG